MRWLFIILAIGLIAYSIVDAVRAAPTEGITPTPMQRRADERRQIEDAIIDKKIALAYGCGYLEGRSRWVQPECIEVRDTARRNGFKP